MGFHDDLAMRALIDGKMPEDFHAAAYKHAQASITLLIIAGIVWWLASWKWALLPLLLGVFIAAQSMSATTIAGKLAYLKSGGSEATEG